MQRQSFLLKDLSILKMPGLPHGLPDYKQLAPHINIILGLNASGKSSTARAIRQLIWREQHYGVQAETTIDIAGEHWDVKIDGNKSSSQHNGADEPIQGIPAVEECGRYMLALHDLIREDDCDLARQIIRESIGGYDLDSACSDLGYAAGPRNRGSLPFKEYFNASGEYDRVKSGQEVLKRDEEKLDSLLRMKLEAEEAGKLLVWYELHASYLSAREKLDLALNRCKEFPEILSKATGEEYAAILKLEAQVETARVAIRAAEEIIKKNREIITGLNFPLEGFEGTTAQILEERITLLNDQERSQLDLEGKISESLLREQEIIKRIGTGLDLTKWAGIEWKDVSILDAFLQRAHQTRSEQQAIEAMVAEWKKELIPTKMPSEEQLNDGIRVLGCWLQEHDSLGKISGWWIWLLGVTGIAAIVGTYYLGALGLWAIIILVGIVLLSRRQQSRITDAREKEYQNTGLENPLSWEPEPVGNCLHALLGQLKESIWQRNVQYRIKLYDTEIGALQPRLEEIEEKKNELLASIKRIPDLPEENLRSFDALFWFLKNVRDWQASHSETVLLTGEFDRVIQSKETNLQEINRLLESVNRLHVNDTVSARATLKQVKESGQVWRDAGLEIKHQQDSIQGHTNETKDLFARIRDIYASLDLEDGQKEILHSLLRQLPPYKQAVEDWKGETRVFVEKKSQLEAHALFEKDSEETELLHQEDVQEKIKSLQSKVDALEEINKTITEIRTKIGMARSGHSLEDVLTKKEESLSQLEAMYDQNLMAITGKMLIDQLKKQTGDHNRPPVFDRAKVLFNRITKGQYDLKLQEGSDPSFRAYDNILRQGQDLSELSTGTRIQLLLSVRLAFIETQETMLRLPVLADELLANSDDIRARAIIEALFEISREGRQVFYFTAQVDEVNKWKTFLDDHADISCQIIPLSGDTNESFNRAEIEPEFRSFRFQMEVPGPEGKTHAEYGELLRVNGYDMLLGNPAQLHLWYVIDDSVLLHGLLRKGIKYWGQLESYLNHSGIMDGASQAVIDPLKDRIKILERFQGLYQRGRPKPIDREVLENSEIISGKFIDAVDEKLKELRGNPRDLLEALRRKEIGGFRTANIEELEQYLIMNGYLDDQQAVGMDEILIRLNAYISNLNLDLAIEEAFIKRILTSHQSPEKADS